MESPALEHMWIVRIRQPFIWKFETEYAHAHWVRQTDCDTIGVGCFINKLHKCIFDLLIFTIYNLQK